MNEAELVEIRAEIDRCGPTPWPESLRTRIRRYLDAAGPGSTELIVLAALEDAAEADRIAAQTGEMNWDKIAARVRTTLGEGGELQSDAGERGDRTAESGRRKRKTRSWRIGASVLVTVAAAILLLVWLRPGAGTPRASLDRLTIQEPGMGSYEFPTQQAEFARDTEVGLRAGAATYRYVVFFDDDGSMRIEELDNGQEHVPWHLTGRDMSAAILLVSKRPIQNIDEVAKQLAAAAVGATLEAGTQVIWTDQGPRVEVIKTMGGPEPSAALPAWAERVQRILDGLESVSTHGYSLPMRGE